MAAVSVLAHEVGHHLAGHTIQSGGSQPPIELEADKFSGFVLYKMGAPREDALVAMRALVPAEVQRDSTNPARDRRLAAIAEGWNQAGRQTGRGDCERGAAGALPGKAPAQSPVKNDPVQNDPMQNDPRTRCRCNRTSIRSRAPRRRPIPRRW